MSNVVGVYFITEDCQYRTVCLVKLKRRPSSGTRAVCYTWILFRKKFVPTKIHLFLSHPRGRSPLSNTDSQLKHWLVIGSSNKFGDDNRFAVNCRQNVCSRSGRYAKCLNQFANLLPRLELGRKKRALVFGTVNLLKRKCKYRKWCRHVMHVRMP